MTADVIESREALDAIAVTEPGVYDLPEATYHADPVPEGSLSCSGAKKLLPPSCPALYKWEREHPLAPKRHFDVGHAAHKSVLGVGAEIVVVPGERWDTNDAKARVAAARIAGQVPVKQAEYDAVQAMVAALRAHPDASVLLAEGSGTPEASLFWRDAETNIMRRARLDWLPHTSPSGRLIVPDVKTAECADPDTFARAAAAYGYPQQHDWYLDGVRALDLAEDAAFLFVIVEKTPPYLVSIVEFDADTVRAGRNRNRRAIDIFARCMAEDYWPGYSDDVVMVSAPYWYTREEDF